MNTTQYNTLVASIKAKAQEILPKGSRLALYGSRARGDYHHDSDWDFHILIPGEDRIATDIWNDIAWQFEKVGLDFGEIVCMMAYTYGDWKRRH